MSGPKRGIWRLYYDPTPARLADLSQYAMRQDAWLQRNGSFVGQFLGGEALACARAARDLVQHYLTLGDPDSGFDAYGQAWALFNQLYRDAAEAQRRRRVEEQARTQRVAESLVSQCRELWQTPQNQTLVQRWVDRADCCQLAQTLAAVGTGTAREVQNKARAWQDRFGQTLRLAGERAAQNAKAVRSCVPALRSAAQAMGEVNADALPPLERRRLEEARARLRGEAEDALTREDLQVLRSAVAGMNALVAEYGPKVRAAQLKKATEAWRTALANCGYGVALRTEPDGTMVLEANGFPMKSVNVRVRPDSEEVNLEVTGRTDHKACVKDVQSLQAELARQGVMLKMTDWGAGTPGGVTQHSQARASVGGAR